MEEYKSSKFTPEQEKWLEALESGDYEQTSSYLKYGDSFCCLGVACDLFDGDAWQLRPGSCNAYEIDGETAYLPSEIKETLRMKDAEGKFDCSVDEIDFSFIDMTTFDPEYDREAGTPEALVYDFEREYEHNDYSMSLAQLNDDWGFDFKQIAQFIRNNPRAIFVE